MTIRGAGEGSFVCVHRGAWSDGMASIPCPDCARREREEDLRSRPPWDAETERRIRALAGRRRR